MLRITLATVIVVVVACLQAGAQIVVSGKITGSDSEALQGAHVVLNKTYKAAYTNSRGEFSISDLKPGKYTVKISYLGYQTLFDTLDLQSDKKVNYQLSVLPFLSDEVVVTATRVDPEAPATVSNLSKAEINQANFGQDMAYLIDQTPSLVATSDAGAGVGYTGIRIRGSDQTRINVTVNGIPINDSESQGVFWVNMPDLASSLQNIQIQRGLGTSTNGAGAFGATINLQTNQLRQKPGAIIDNSYGSFNTHKHTVQANTGLNEDNFAFETRLSAIQSDGYIDRASSDLKSYYLSGGYYGSKTILKAVLFGGEETTYQSWNGTPESRLKGDVEAMRTHAANEGYNEAQLQNLLNSGRTYNYYLYENQIDHYNQNHYQLHFSQELDERFTLNLAGHYTAGRGYYEEYKYGDDLEDYGLKNVIYLRDTLYSNGFSEGAYVNSDFASQLEVQDLEVIFNPVVANGDTIRNPDGDVLLDATAQVSSSDIIRRRWLDNDFYGATYSLNYKSGMHHAILGGGYHIYTGEHFGEILWAENAPGIDYKQRYYHSDAKKTDFNVYGKYTFSINNWNLMADLQLRSIHYSTAGKDNDQSEFDIDREFLFFNPKVGARYGFENNSSAYIFAGRGSREPVRDDFLEAPAGTEPEAEVLNNVEAGYEWAGSNVYVKVNGYGMFFENQLVLTGELNDVGASVRQNVGESYRAGIELQWGLRLAKNLTWDANAAFSRNRIRTFNELFYTDEGLVVNTYKDTEISFSPSEVLASTISWNPWKGLDLAFQSKYVGAQYLDNTMNENRQLDAYFVNNLLASFQWKPKFAESIKINLMVNNLFDELYSSNGYTYSYYYDGLITENFYYPQAGRNYLVGLTLEL